MIFIVILLTISSFCYTEAYNMQLISHLSYEQYTSDITGFAQDGRGFLMGDNDYRVLFWSTIS